MVGIDDDLHHLIQRNRNQLQRGDQFSLNGRETMQAVATLWQSLRLAAGEGYVRPFLELGSDMYTLLSLVGRHWLEFLSNWR